MHVTGIVVLILVVLSSVFWMSAAHNKLAKRSSEDLVAAGITSLRQRTLTLVKDYSAWDEGYAALLTGDREWLYSNIGASVVEIGTFDMALVDAANQDVYFGWAAESPPEGETGLLPDTILRPVLALLDQPGPSNVQTRTLIAEFQGSPWIFAVSHVTPVEGPPEGVPLEDLPIQVHGMRLSDERLEQIGRSLLVDDLMLAAAPAEGKAAVALIDFSGATIGYVTWDPPHPGARILGQVALPLGLALLLVAVVSGVSSRYAVRSARSLERALFAAKAADRSKTEFLSNVSHELRTPMNGILGVAQLLRTTSLDDEQRELVSVLFASATAQMALISDLLDVSRLESGNRQLVEEPFEPAAVLKDVTEMMRVAADKKGVRLECAWDPLAVLTVIGDERAFRQIVTNLLGNAVKFTDKGQVTMDAHTDAGREGVRIVLRVSDTGRGIAAEALTRVFERFYQADSSLTRSTEGTGLGLAISQSLARMMGGQIEVASEVGVGSTFTFTASFEIADTSRGALDAA
jgi:signal transduction histidine kinase